MTPAAVTFQARLAAFPVAQQLGQTQQQAAIRESELTARWRRLTPAERVIVGRGNSWAISEEGPQDRPDHSPGHAG